MAIFACDLLIEGCCEQLLEGTSTLAMYVLSCACNGLLATVKPLTNVASKWSFLDAICSLQGVAGSNHCYHLLAMIYSQQFTYNGSLARLIFIR